jgi:hypothetical protein
MLNLLRYDVNIKSAANASAIGINLGLGFAAQTFVASTTTIACFRVGAVATTAKCLIDTSIAYSVGSHTKS